MPVFNREMLTLARESRGMTQIQLADHLCISQPELSKYETGIREPSEEMVSLFAKHLEYTVEFFQLNESIRSFGSVCVYHRKRQSATETKLQHLLALINVKRIQVKQLMKSVDVRTFEGFEQMDINDKRGGAGAIARKVRLLWNLPPGPIQNLVRAVEDAGGIVIQADFGSDKVDALSQSLPGYPPIFLINKAIPTDRMRFTLAHEIGHIIMHRLPTDDMEREADRFAAELLMPEEQIRPQLAFVNLPQLATLKTYWRVSMNSLLYRAAEIGTIDARRKSYLWMMMGKAGYRKSEPGQIAPEIPMAVAELIQLHGTSLGYTHDEIGRVLCEPDSFMEFRGSRSGGRLRLVR